MIEPSSRFFLDMQGNDCEEKTRWPMWTLQQQQQPQLDPTQREHSV